MKIGKYITLDPEIGVLLDGEENASRLINHLLTEYYDVNSRNFEKKLKEMRIRQREIRLKMHEIKLKMKEKVQKDEQMWKNRVEAKRSELRRRGLTDEETERRLQKWKMFYGKD
jgi:hypothetical protein